MTDPYDWERPGAKEVSAAVYRMPLPLPGLSTHFHPDHYTLAVELRRRTGCHIALGTDERSALDSIIEGDQGESAFGASLIRSGFPVARLAGMRPGDNAALYDYPSGWLRDGDRPKAGGRELQAVASPGHSRGHLTAADVVDEYAAA